MNPAQPIDWQALAQAARQARQNAYAPYSHFAVGAAVLGASGKIYLGCNIENASYGLTLCAERVALANMVASGERSLRAIAVVTQGAIPSPPCGICRQALAEFAEDLPVYLASASTDGPVRTTSLAALLADPFRPQTLAEAMAREEPSEK